MTKERTAGILLHPTSLPGKFGIGDLGESAIAFIHILAESGMRRWQILPLGPTGYGNSPYQTLSAFAGNHLLISAAELEKEGLITEEFTRSAPVFPQNHVDYGKVLQFNRHMIQHAFASFNSRAFPELKTAFENYRQECADWLPDYALFKAIKEAHNGCVWNTWPHEIVHREPAAMARWRDKLHLQVERVEFEQFLFARQWQHIKSFAAEKGIKIIGDIPIFVAFDSADVWAHPELFRLDAAGNPEVVAGVPPDYFSKTGQLWGNPLYRWDKMEQTGFSWWIARLQNTLKYVDIVRLDHFRGFEAYWEVPAKEETAVNGNWEKGPGEKIFVALQKKLGTLPLIAEDLGYITPEVKKLRDRFGFPGMKVLQFGFGEDEGSRAFLPHNHTTNCVVYTGTHDNDTSIGWFTNNHPGQSTLSPEELEKQRRRALRYMNTDGREINWDLIRLAFSSVAHTAIIPMQDVLGLGSEARMNVPGKPDGNWEWRFAFEWVTHTQKAHLAELVDLYDRAGTAPPGSSSEPVDGAVARS